MNTEEMSQGTSVCNLCDHPGTFSESIERALVRCHVKRFQKDFFTVWRCNNCQSLHSLENVNLLPYYQEYPLKYHRLDWVTRLAYRNRLRQIQKCGLHPKSSILDYGCGQGLFVQFLNELGFQAWGYDRYAEQFCDNRVLSRSYDCLTCQDVIEHVDDPFALLNSLAELVRPGGLLAIGTPLADEINLEQSYNFGFELSQPYHRHILSRERLSDMGERCGLRIAREYNRFYYDTIVPGVNSRFIWEYLKFHDNVIDPCFEDPHMADMLKSSKLLTSAFLGYLAPPRSNLLLIFEKTSDYVTTH